MEHGLARARAKPRRPGDHGLLVQRGGIHRAGDAPVLDARLVHQATSLKKAGMPANRKRKRSIAAAAAWRR